MKIVIAIACLLAAVVPAHSLDPDEMVGKYMDYLLPYMQPCIAEFKITEDQITSMKQLGELDHTQLGCLKACVMKRLGILTGLDFHMEPIYDMINTIHKGNQADIAEVTAIADGCLPKINGLTDECAIGNIYTDCCMDKFFS